MRVLILILAGIALITGDISAAPVKTKNGVPIKTKKGYPVQTR